MNEEEMSLADHAEAWCLEKKYPLPRRGTVEWQKMYKEWIEYAFPL